MIGAMNPLHQEVSTTKPSSPRVFTLFDAIVMVAATGSGFALFKVMQIRYLAGFGRSLLVMIPVGVTETMIPFLTMWSLAVAGLSLRQPRQPFRKLARQPGMIACCAAMLPLVIELVAIIVGELILPPNAVVGRTIPPYVIRSLPRRIMHDVRGSMVLQANAGGTVAVAWLILALAGMWKSEKSWLDRFGRVLGILWITVNIVMHASTLLF
jgi:hypothetical protein